MNINFNPFGFGAFGEILSLRLSVYLGEQLVQQQQMQAPSEILRQRFYGLCKEVKATGQPYHVRFEGQETVYDDLEKRSKTLPVSLDYWTWDVDDEEMERWK